MIPPSTSGGNFPSFVLLKFTVRILIGQKTKIKMWVKIVKILFKNCPPVANTFTPLETARVRVRGVTQVLHFIYQMRYFCASVLSQVYLTSQTFLTLNGPGIFYSTHAVRTHASAAAGMNRHAWTGMHEPACMNRHACCMHEPACMGRHA